MSEIIALIQSSMYHHHPLLRIPSVKSHISFLKQNKLTLKAAKQQIITNDLPVANHISSDSTHSIVYKTIDVDNLSNVSNV